MLMLKISFDIAQWFLLCVLICVFLPNHVDSSSAGAYMSAYLRRQKNHTNIKDLKNSGPISSYELHQDRLGLTRLKHLDSRYSTCNGIDIRELTIFQVQGLFDANLLTSLDLTNCYIRRIHQMNTVLKAVLELNPNAINEAFKADQERNSVGFRYRSPMHGIPILIKDNIATKDHMLTTAGSWALVGLRPKKDADIVKILRKAGVVILGKSNLSEFSAFRGNLPSGWSGRGGQSLSPYSLGTDPWGSSTGSATGIAANLAMVSIGTETDGSLISPASAAGISALKPTLGTISTSGVIPISKHQDCVGPMARSVLDLAVLFDAMTSEYHKMSHACGGSYMQCLLKPKYLKTFRVGVIRYPFWDPSATRSSLLDKQLPHLDKLLMAMRDFPDIRVIDPVRLQASHFENISCEKELTVFLHDFKHEINEYLAKNVIQSESHPVKVKSLRDIIQFNKLFSDGMDQGMLEMAEETDGIFNDLYLEARESNQFATRSLLNNTIHKYRLDALMFPNPLPSSMSEFTSPEELDNSLKDKPLLGFQLAAIAGYPSLNVPAGISSNGVPFGVTFIGTPDSEARLLQIGYLMEKLNPARQPPQFKL